MPQRQPARPRAGLLGDLSGLIDQTAVEAARWRLNGEAALRIASHNVDMMKRQAAATGREAIADVSRRFQKPTAPSPTRNPPFGPLHSPPPRRSQFVQRATEQGLAGARGAQDAFTFGLGDRAYAGVGSLLDATHGENLADAYTRRMAVERARDNYDAQHYAAARTVGQVIGTGAQIAATGAVGGAALAGFRAAQGGARIAQATPLIAREIAALGAGGGAFGVGSQAATDLSRGHLSALGDYAGAGVGGAAGALTARTGRAGYVGAVDGATTSLAQDWFNGRPPSIEHARQSALMGAALGAGSGLGGRVIANGLSRAAKEELGEAVSLLRTASRGDKTLTRVKSREYLPNQRYTYPDQRTSRELVESKFGRSAKLSPRQTEASEMLNNYRVDHTLPEDIGAALALPTTSLGLLGMQNPYHPLRLF